MSTTKEQKKKKTENDATVAKQKSDGTTNSAYKKLQDALMKDKKKYASDKFKNCWPVAREISETVTNTVWDDAMKIIQDHPSVYTRTAGVCFFAFLCAAIDAHLEMRYAKAIQENELPKLEIKEATSDMVKILLERSKVEMNTEGQLLLKNLLERDFGYLMAVLKALNIENTALHNLLVSGFRFYVWEVMVPHLFLSEKKQEEAHA